MTKTTTRIGAGLLALALAACGAQDDEYLAAIPDAEGLTLEIQGGAAEGLALTAGDAAEPIAADGTPVTNDDLGEARAKIRALNEAVRAVFQRVGEVAASGGQERPGGVKVFGPADRCVQQGPAGCLAEANLRLVVRRVGARVGGFALEARPVGETLDTAFAPVLAGYLVRGETARRGAGRLWVNLENLSAAAGDGYLGQGYMVAGFASGPVAKTATYRMLGFTPDGSRHGPVTAAFSGFLTANRTARVRVAGLADLVTGPDLELGIGRLAYDPAFGGRAYSIVTSWLDRSTVPPTPRGDVPAGQYWFSRACYAPAGTLPVFKEWFLCDRAQGPRACVVAQGGTWRDAIGIQVAGNPGDTWASTCARAVEPPEMDPPTAPPADDASDVSPEEGQSATGLDPEPVPADPVNPGDSIDPPQG